MIAFDTNVLIYACDQGEPRRQALALDLIERSTQSVLLRQVACEFLAASRKLLRHGFGPDAAWERLHQFIDLFPLIYPREGVLERARTLHVESRMSFWDAMVVAACLDAGVQTLYRRICPAGSCLSRSSIPSVRAKADSRLRSVSEATAAQDPRSPAIAWLACGLIRSCNERNSGQG